MLKTYLPILALGQRSRLSAIVACQNEYIIPDILIAYT
jgi:hypothetical protein